MSKNIAIIGSSGAIGNAFVEHYLKDNAVEKIFSFSRSVNSHTSKKFIVLILILRAKRA